MLIVNGHGLDNCVFVSITLNLYGELFVSIIVNGELFVPIILNGDLFS